MGLEFNLTVLPWILAAVTKYLSNGFRSTLTYVEQLGGLLCNLRHISDCNIDVDAPADAPRQGFHRLKVSNRHKNLGTHFGNGYHASHEGGDLYINERRGHVVI